MAVKLIQLTDNIRQDMLNQPVKYAQADPNLVVAETHEKVVTIKNETPALGWAPQTQVTVDCTCPDFQFRWAYVLWKHDGLLYPEKYVLEPPKKKNPGMTVGACKHVTRVIQDLLEKV